MTWRKAVSVFGVEFQVGFLTFLTARVTSYKFSFGGGMLIGQGSQEHHTQCCVGLLGITLLCPHQEMRNSLNMVSLNRCANSGDHL